MCVGDSQKPEGLIHVCLVQRPIATNNLSCSLPYILMANLLELRYWKRGLLAL
uniref:Uncharacterized protein n=2 Tax=Picea TaxID=3328 RepID=A0A117NHR8_PICGL|nr:hypothetical protein ABT39_MTgene4153 [Picea glauca]QHR90339.1 hypothetical protein Q903MT_gene4362 [Picea sitchensis]